MLRLGVVSELGKDENMGYARVDFDEAGIVSAWLPLPSASTKTAKIWLPIETGSQVSCLMDDECEQGTIQAALWSDDDTPPDWASDKTIGILFADGAKLYYDSEKSKLYFEKINADIEIKCNKLKITGEVDVTGDINATGDIKTDLGKIEGFQVSATMPTMTAPTGVSLSTHAHATAAPGPPSPPQPM